MMYQLQMSPLFLRSVKLNVVLNVGLLKVLMFQYLSIANIAISRFQSYKPERNKKGANLPVAQLVFHMFDRETAQHLLQKTAL